MGLDTSHLDNYDSSTRFYEKEELESLIKKSSLWQELYRYYRCRSNKEINNLKGYIEKHNIDTSHLKNKTAREIINSCSDKELEDLISTCRGWNQVVEKLGFRQSSGNQIKKIILNRKINISFKKELHTPNSNLNKIKSRPVKDLEGVVERSSNWRNLVHNINEEYGTFYDDTAYKRIKKLIESLNIDTSHFDVHDEISKLTEEQFKERLKELFNDNIILIGPFENTYKETWFECKEHGKFLKRPKDLLKGGKCPKCTESRGETIVRSFLDIHNIKYEQWKSFGDCRNLLCLPFDFYLPDYNICIEFQGSQHLRPIRFYGCSEEDAIKSHLKTVENDKIKKEYCKKKNIPLIEIFDAKEVPEKLGFLVEITNINID